MKDTKVKQGLVSPVCCVILSLVVWFCPDIALAQTEQYAVQIAAVRSQKSADELRYGLLARGLDAYWVKGVLPKHGLFYRVRVGNFPSIESAYGYAEGLLDTGLLEAYAITNYETPSSESRDMLQASMEVQEFLPQRQSLHEAVELMAALRARQWWLPANRNSTTSLQQPSMSSREMLVYMLGKQQWHLSQDVSVLVLRGPRKNEIAKIADEMASPSRLNTLSAQPVRPPSTPPAQPPVEFLPSSSLSSASSPISPGNPSVGVVKATSTDIGRGRSSTTARGGIRYAAPPRLQGTVEMLDGQLVLKLRNLDEGRSFTGLARITLNDDKRSTDAEPLQFNLPPDTEQVFPINQTMMANGNWMMMVFDENGIMRMVRGASFGQKTNPPVQTAQSSPQTPVYPAELTPPPYVTGVFDTTMQSTPQPQSSMPQSIANGNGSNPIGGANNFGGNNPGDAAQGTGDVTGQVVVVPRQIAATSENVTMEFDISAPRPLNYISVTLLSAEYRDVRQAMMSTPRGRVPFLVPMAQATGPFTYEIKDESGRVLATGTGDFRQLARGN